jgi:crossover junction endodeoxyribonuclease RuvC
MRICGIDPSLNQTGYAVIRMTAPGRNASVIEAGVIRTPAGVALPARLVELAQTMDQILAEHRPDLVGLEELYSHYAHPRTAILMGHARGALVLSAARAGVEVISLAATRIKRALTGNGRATKVQVQRAVMVTFGLSRLPEPPDVADALAIALCAGSERLGASPPARIPGRASRRLEAGNVAEPGRPRPGQQARGQAGGTT